MLSLAASAFVVLAAEPLYLLVDTGVVGHLGAVPLAALGVAGALMSLVLLLGTFVEYGTTARAARAFGAGRTDVAVDEGVQASWLAVGIGTGMAVLGEVTAPWSTTLLSGGSGAVQQAAQSWLRIALVGVPGVLLVLAGNGWMRGVQETRSPVRIVLVANALSAAACPPLVYGLGLGLQGSAVANVAGQAVGGGLFLVALRARAKGFAPSWVVMRGQLRMGRDLLLRSLAFQVAFLAAAGVASRMGTAQIAAHQIGLQLWEFTALMLDSFAIAPQSLVGAALGGSDEAGARRLAVRVGRWGLWAGTAFAALAAAGYGVLPDVFTASPAVLQQTRVLWPWFVAMLPVAGFVFALDGVLVGAGDVAFMAWLTVLAGVGVFAPVSIAALQWHWGLGGVWAGLAAFVTVRLVGMLVRIRGDRWVVLGAAPGQH
ncbi:MAG: MATE family efflux transporter [Actinomycetota bacterium]|nr:MATE family efflux transporter [Actinomycetota bacterium]